MCFYIKPEKEIYHIYKWNNYQTVAELHHSVLPPNYSIVIHYSVLFHFTPLFLVGLRFGYFSYVFRLHEWLFELLDISPVCPDYMYDYLVVFPYHLSCVTCIHYGIFLIGKLFYFPPVCFIDKLLYLVLYYTSSFLFIWFLLHNNSNSSPPVLLLELANASWNLQKDSIYVKPLSHKLHLNGSILQYVFKSVLLLQYILFALIRHLSHKDSLNPVTQTAFKWLIYAFTRFTPNFMCIIIPIFKYVVYFTLHFTFPVYIYPALIRYFLSIIL